MNSVFATALTGLNRAAQNIMAVADNVANVDTPGYRAMRIQSNGTAAYRNRPDTTDDAESAIGASDVDLATELVELRRSDQAFRANAVMIERERRRLGTLLDLRA